MGSMAGQTCYPVKMKPYSKESRLELLTECSTADVVSKKRYLNIPAAFDTETSSFKDESDGEESAIVYIWMFGIGDTVIYGRTMDEFIELIDYLNKWLVHFDGKLIVYIHFAKFDFSFIKFLFKWDHVFLKENRDVLYARYGNIEFRDSLVLSGGQSLANIGKKLRKQTLKAEGDLDYELIRHFKTPLTQKELHYCEMDIRVLCEYIREKIEDDGDISQIPYTNTGYVRRYVRDECFKDRRGYSNFIAGLTMTPRAYTQATDAFRGGSVSNNFSYTGKLCEDVRSYDIKSSYPYVMVTGYYPINFFEQEIGMVNQTMLYNESDDRINWLLNNKCCMFELELWDLEPKYEYYFPISRNKCHTVIGPLSTSDYVEAASGRIISALYLKTTVTELDFDTIKKFYTFTKYRITDMRVAPRGFLPYPIVKSIIKFFNDKTSLDGIHEMKREYMISKNMLDSVYGMMVEKPVRPVFGFVNDYGFTKDEPDFVSAIDEYNEKFNRFLFYPWGIWVTAQARYRLHEAILAVGDDFRYCDTDSVKFVGNHDEYFSLANQTARRNIELAATRYRIPIEHIIPKNSKGHEKVMGAWEKEYEHAKFKTLGAKRYMVQYENGEYELTVAGTNKEHTLEYIIKEAEEQKISPFDVFNTDLRVPPEYAKRTVSKFIDHERYGWVTDYLGNTAWYDAPSGIYVAPTSYSFSITDEMKDVILWLEHDGFYQDGQI